MNKTCGARVEDMQPAKRVTPDPPPVVPIVEGRLIVLYPFTRLGPECEEQIKLKANRL